MKLIKRTYYLTSLWLIPVTIIGSIFCFIMIEHIAYEETDEFLTYEMQRLIKYHEENNDLPEFHKVADILPGIFYHEPVFKDTLLLEAGDNEMVPHRELYFSINHKGEPFTIVLRHLLLGRDDIAEGTLLIVVGIILLFASFLIFILNLITRKLWQPFYSTLNKISNYRTGNQTPKFETNNIDEFQLLNNSLNTLLIKIDNDFKRNKEFNENLSHELQTQLAIIRSTTENILDQNENDFNYHIDGLKKIYSAVNKLHQIQKSLLLLSKIENLEYSNTQDVDFQLILTAVIEKYKEAFELRKIQLSINTSNCNLIIDQGLAEIFVNNLIKNALKHNIPDGFVNIKLTSSQLTIENSGHTYTGNSQQLFERFKIGRKGNYGIGLSIVKQICELHNYKITYQIVENSIHKICIYFR